MSLHPREGLASGIPRTRGNAAGAVRLSAKPSWRSGVLLRFDLAHPQLVNPHLLPVTVFEDVVAVAVGPGFRRSREGLTVGEPDPASLSSARFEQDGPESTGHTRLHRHEGV